MTSPTFLSPPETHRVPPPPGGGPPRPGVGSSRAPGSTEGAGLGGRARTCSPFMTGWRRWKPRSATEEEILRVHTREHLDRVRDLADRAMEEERSIPLDSDTLVSGASWDAALGSSGAVLTAVDGNRAGGHPKRLRWNQTARASCHVPPGPWASASSTTWPWQPGYVQDRGFGPTGAHRGLGRAPRERYSGDLLRRRQRLLPFPSSIPPLSGYGASPMRRGRGPGSAPP